MTDKTITLKGEIAETLEAMSQAQGRSIEAILKQLLAIKSPPSLSWHEFIDKTAGSLADDPIERPQQPPLDEREPLE